MANKGSDSSSDTLFKDLTFNVNLNSDDLEAKKNLVLPYELIGYGLKINFKHKTILSILNLINIKDNQTNLK